MKVPVLGMSHVVDGTHLQIGFIVCFAATRQRQSIIAQQTYLKLLERTVGNGYDASMKFCADCGKGVEDDKLVVCPDCKGTLNSTPSEKSKLTEAEIVRVSKAAWRRTWRKHVLLIVGEFSVLMILELAAFYYAYQAGIKIITEKLVSDIAKEFQTDRIRATVSQVASNEARGLVLSQINPEV